MENNNINWNFIKSCDKVIGELSFADMMSHKQKLSKAKQRNYKGGYSLSANTEYLIEVKNDYMNGKITEEYAKGMFLKQKLCGNAV